MNPAQHKLFSTAVELHKQQRYSEAEELYNRVLNGLPQEENLVFCLADLYLRKDFNGLATHLLANLIRNNPTHAEAWCNLGVAYRKENKNDLAKMAWEQAIELKGETAEVCNNMASLYADLAEPEKALEWCERGLKLAPDEHSILWNKSLALLTLGEFDEGWKLYQNRQKKEGWDARTKTNVPLWDGSYVDHLYIHGEQGVGDEIMFASAIPHVLGKAGKITLEVNAKVAGIAKQTWPEFTVVKEEAPDNYDAKIPIGSLIGMYGMNPKPYLNPHPEKVAFYRRELEKLGPGPYVALTWLGGTKYTRAHERSLSLGDLEPFMQRFTCVSAQYSPIEFFGPVEKERNKWGLRKINDASCGDDLHDQAALFKACDAVVTVQQTAVHVAGGVGAKTFALIGSHPHWRYGVKGEVMPFYSSVRLFRKQKEWSEVIERALSAVERELSRAESRVA